MRFFKRCTGEIFVDGFGDRRRRLCLEVLEQKHLLSADLTTVVDTSTTPDTMYILGTGTPGDDTFEVETLPNTRIRIEIHGEDGSEVTGTYNTILLEAQAAVNGQVFGGYRLRGLDGDDIMDASDLTHDGVDMRGGGGADQLIGGSGEDILMAGPEGILLSPFVDTSTTPNTLYIDGRGTGADDTFNIRTLPGGDVAIDIRGADGSFVRDTFRTVHLATIADSEGQVFGGYRMYGRGGDDRMDAGRLKNVGVEMRGGGGDDWLTGGAKDDILRGGAGNDIVDRAGPEDVAIEGGSEYDTLEFRISGPGVDYTNRSFEHITATQDDDRIDSSANPGPVHVEGLAGEDILIGGEFEDELIGGQGDDTLKGGGGSDYLAGNPGDDDLIGQQGNDTLVGEGGDDTLSGGGGHDQLQGGIGDDHLDGGLGDDVLSGGEGDDTLFGGDGVDQLDGGAHETADVADFTVAPAGVCVDLSSEIATDDGYGNTEAIKNVENVIGASAGGNTITGDSGANNLVGGDAADILDGLGGDDTLGGLGGNDLLRGGPGADTLDGGSGDDELFGDAGADTLLGRNGNDHLDAGADSDVLFGGDGVDSLFGGAGYFTDVLDGGAGTDWVDGQDGADVLMDGGDNDADTLVSEYAAAPGPQSMVDIALIGGELTSILVPGTTSEAEKTDAQLELTPPYGGNLLGLPSFIRVIVPDEYLIIFP